MKSGSTKVYKSAEDISSDVWVGIDQSYSGFSVTLYDTSGNWKTWVHKAEGSGVARLWNIQAFLYSIFYNEIEPNLIEVKDVAMEGYAFGSQMANMLGELGGLVKMFFYEEFSIRPLLVPPTSLKKYVTGKGTGVQKSQMLLHVFKKWGVEFTDDNAADSYSLARISARLAYTKYEEEILEKLNDIKFRA